MAFIGLIKGLISDAVARQARIDASTHSMQTITYPHHEIHGASMHHVYTNSSGTGFNSGDELWLAFKTPTGPKQCHTAITISVTGAASFKIIQAPTLALDLGSQRVSHNHNLDDGSASTIESIETTPTAGEYSFNEDAGGGEVTGGTVIDEKILGSGMDKVSGEGRSAEWILAPDTVYAFVIISAAASIRANITIDFYEHTPKN